MKTLLAFLAMISLTVVANLLMKTGAVQAEATKASSWAILNWRTVAGLASFGIAALIYAAILQWLPLNVAQSFATAQFIAVILASAVVLGEPIGPLQWVGIVLISLGIATVGWSRS